MMYNRGVSKGGSKVGIQNKKLKRKTICSQELFFLGGGSLHMKGHTMTVLNTLGRNIFIPFWYID